jgi:hypothetical protein
MRDFDRKKPSPTPDDINLQTGSHFYPIREVLIDGKTKGSSDENTEVDLIEIAKLAQEARAVIEKQGGIFNGVIERRVERRDPLWMGSIAAVAVLYALAHLE